MKKKDNDRREAFCSATCKNYLWTQDDRRGQVYQLKHANLDTDTNVKIKDTHNLNKTKIIIQDKPVRHVMVGSCFYAQVTQISKGRVV